MGAGLRCLLLAGVLGLAACAKGGDEARIREALAELEAAAEQRQLGPVREHLMEKFSGQGGQYDKRGFENLIRALILRHQEVEVSVSDLHIAVQGGRAEVGAKVLLLGGAGGWLPERGQLYAVASVWRLDEGEWRVHQARWEPVL